MGGFHASSPRAGNRYPTGTMSAWGFCLRPMIPAYWMRNRRNRMTTWFSIYQRKFTVGNCGEAGFTQATFFHVQLSYERTSNQTRQ
jgi:hypothetical protein